MKPKKLGLIFGGRSGEHEISIISAQSIATHIDKDKYRIYPIYISKSGKWLNASASKKILKIDFDGLLKSGSKKDLKKTFKEISALSKQSGFSFNFKQEKISAVFPCLHGPYGEDGTIQGLLEMHNLPYVGCDVLSSALTMDKGMSKIAFKHAGLNVADFLIFHRHEFQNDITPTISAIESKFSYPVFVKPANMGSSVGITKVKNAAGLEKALYLAAKYDRKILIEESVDAREFEVAILGNQSPIASPVGEIVPCNEFYDFDAKYVKGTSELFIPAKIEYKLSDQIRQLALTAYKSTGCEGMARVDFLMEKHTGKLYLNEINTIPGFTSISMYPKLFTEAGISYPELIHRLIMLALERHADKSNIKTI